MLGSKITIELDDGSKFWVFIYGHESLTIQGARPGVFKERTYDGHSAESIVHALTFSETARNEFFL